MMGKRLLVILLNLLLILLAFWLVTHLRGTVFMHNLLDSYPWLLVYSCVYIVTGLLFDKYNYRKSTGLNAMMLPVLYSHLSFVGIASFSIVLLSMGSFPRILLFGTQGILAIAELLVAFAVAIMQGLKQKRFTYEGQAPAPVKSPAKKPHLAAQINSFKTVHGKWIRDTILQQTGENIFNHLKSLVSLVSEETVVLHTSRPLNLVSLPVNKLSCIVNLQRVNHILNLDDFFYHANRALPPNGSFVGCGETHFHRKKRFLSSYTPFLGSLMYAFDFMIHRAAPKLPFSKNLYYSLTKGRNRVLSRAEMLGRLYYSGFEVVDEEVVDGLLFFLAKKQTTSPKNERPSYGVLISLRRIGKNNKVIGVYKLRTMHPYSEYLQPYIHKHNNIAPCGKFKNDFRISTLGRIARRFWIDELPMLINWLRGDLKLVGVRPLSEHYFNLYPKELQLKRVQFRPGLVPPYYADMPNSLEEIVASELRYLQAYEQNPLRTDWIYFWRAFYNIVFRNVRSK